MMHELCADTPACVVLGSTSTMWTPQLLRNQNIHGTSLARHVWLFKVYSTAGNIADNLTDQFSW